MTLSINLTNSYNNNLFVKFNTMQEIDKKIVDNKGLKSLSKDCTNIANTAQSQIQPSSGKETLLSLQELKESTITLLVPAKIVAINLQKEPVLDDTPRLSWLIGRDNELYDSYTGLLSRGTKAMDIFSEIVGRTKDNRFISHKDMVFLQSKVISFQGGYDTQQKARATTNDPIVHKVIDYVMPKTQARLQLIKDYLASKELDPVEIVEMKEREARIDSLFSDKKIEEKPDMTLSISQSKITHPIDFKSLDITEKLLEFLTKDSRWYEWYLRDDSSEPFKSFPLTKAASLNEIV